MSQLPRYDSYKESGIKWLGEIPSHWSITKFKYHVYFQEGPGILAVDFRNEGVPLIRIAGLKTNKVTLDGCNFLDQEKVEKIWKHFKLAKDDLVISASASSSEACEVSSEAIGSIPYTGLIKVRPNLNTLNKDFLKLFLSSSIFYEQVSNLKTGSTIQHYGPAHLKQIFIIVLPLSEQKNIVNFLDKCLAQIDALIAKQEILLEKLAEQRIALISHAVTKGLNPDVEMKESGIEWLGKIPSHWFVKQLKFAVTCNDEVLGEATEVDYEIFYIDISSVSLTEGIQNKEEITFGNAPSRARRVVKNGDVLVSTVRTYLKAITYIESAENNLIASTGFAVLRPSKQFDSKFIGYWIQSEGMVGNIVANSVGVSYPAINSTDLIRLPIVELSLNEQKGIAEYLDMKTKKYQRIEKKYKQMIEKLKEYRSTLITQVVTGKIDVRDISVN